MRTLKIFLINIIISACMPVFAAAELYTNGVYYTEGKTVEVDKAVHEVVTTNNVETLYFSNGLIVKVNTNSDFLINSFFQNVTNNSSSPERLKFDSSNFSATLNKGSVMVSYQGADENSSCVISTALTDYELSKGTFYIQTSDNKAISFTLDGSLKTNAGKSVATTPTGYASIVIQNDIGILDAKVSLYTDKLKQSVIDTLNKESKSITTYKSDILFIRIGGKTVGVLL